MSNISKPTRPNQRQRILDVAHKLFAERGFDQVTMDDVATEAGVARATVFNNFGSKHALIDGLVEGVINYYKHMLENALAARETPVPVLIRSLFAEMAVGIEEDRQFYRSVFREIVKHRLGLDAGSAAQRAGPTLLEHLVHLFTRGQARGEITRRHRPEDLASAFDGLVNGTITHWLYGDAKESLRARMRRVADIFLDAAVDGIHASSAGRLVALAPARQRGEGADRTSASSEGKKRTRKK